MRDLRGLFFKYEVCQQSVNDLFFSGHGGSFDSCQALKREYFEYSNINFVEVKN